MVYLGPRPIRKASLISVIECQICQFRRMNVSPFPHTGEPVLISVSATPPPHVGGLCSTSGSTTTHTLTRARGIERTRGLLRQLMPRPAIAGPRPGALNFRNTTRLEVGISVCNTFWCMEFRSEARDSGPARNWRIHEAIVDRCAQRRRRRDYQAS